MVCVVQHTWDTRKPQGALFHSPAAKAQDIYVFVLKWDQAFLKTSQSTKISPPNLS